MRITKSIFRTFEDFKNFVQVKRFFDNNSIFLFEVPPSRRSPLRRSSTIAEVSV